MRDACRNLEKVTGLQNVCGFLGVQKHAAGQDKKAFRPVFVNMEVCAGVPHYPVLQVHARLAGQFLGIPTFRDAGEDFIGVNWRCPGCKERDGVRWHKQ